VNLSRKLALRAAEGRPLRAGEVLDGEGGACVWGKCIPPVRTRALDALPTGLARGIRLARDVAEGAILTAADAPADPAGEAGRIRAEMVARCGGIRDGSGFQNSSIALKMSCRQGLTREFDRQPGPVREPPCVRPSTSSSWRSCCSAAPGP
jgi:predicted homoserine dehydrogenase-like protein